MHSFFSCVCVCVVCVHTYLDSCERQSRDIQQVAAICIVLMYNYVCHVYSRYVCLCSLATSSTDTPAWKLGAEGGAVSHLNLSKGFGCTIMYVAYYGISCSQSQEALEALSSGDKRDRALRDKRPSVTFVLCYNTRVCIHAQSGSGDVRPSVTFVLTCIHIHFGFVLSGS